MPNPPDYHINPFGYIEEEDAWQDFEQRLGVLKMSGSVHISEPTSRGERTLSFFGSQSRVGAMDVNWDPITQRFVYAGQEIMPIGGVEATPGSALAQTAFHAWQASTTGRQPFETAWQASVRSRRESMEWNPYVRSPLGQGLYTGGYVQPEFAAMQRGSMFMTQKVPDTAYGLNMPMWVQENLERGFVVDPRALAGAGEHGPRITQSAAYEIFPGFATRPGEMMMPYSGEKAESRARILGNLNPSRTSFMSISPQAPFVPGYSRVAGLQDVMGPEGPLRTWGAMLQTAFVPGLALPGAGQITVAPEVARNITLSQYTEQKEQISYGRLRNWAASGLDVVTGGADQTYQPGQAAYNFAGTPMSPEARQLQGTYGYRPAGQAQITLPYNQELLPFLKDLFGARAGQVFSAEATRTLGAPPTVLTTAPRNPADMAAREAWANYLRPQMGGAFGGAEIVFGGASKDPQFSYGAEILSPLTTGRSLGNVQAVKGAIQVGPIPTGLRPGTQMVIGGEAVKGTPFLYDFLGNTLPQEVWSQFGAGPQAWEGGMFRPGRDPVGIQNAMAAMLNPANRERFNQLATPYGGGLFRETTEVGVDPSIARMYSPGTPWHGMGGMQMIQREGAWFARQQVDALYGRVAATFAESPERGGPARMNLQDVMEISRNNPGILQQLYAGMASSAQPFAESYMAATGLTPASRQREAIPGMIPPSGRTEALAYIQSIARNDPQQAAALERELGQGNAPLRFQLEAMRKDPNFSGMGLRFGSTLGWEGPAYNMESPETLLKTIPFDPTGAPIGPYGSAVQKLLGAMPGFGEQNSSIFTQPLIAGAQRAQLNFATQQGVLRESATGMSSLGSLTGRLSYVGGMKGDTPRLIVGDEEYQRISGEMQELYGTDPSQMTMGSMMGLSRRWPGNVASGANWLTGTLVSASQAAKLGAWGGDMSAARSFRGLGTSYGAMFNINMGDVDKDTWAFFGFLSQLAPNVRPTEQIREQMLTMMQQQNPEAVQSYIAAMAERGVQVDPGSIDPYAIMAWARNDDGSAAPNWRGGKLMDALLSTERHQSMWNWFNEKAGAPHWVTEEALLQSASSKALGNKMIGYMDIFSGTLAGMLDYQGNPAGNAFATAAMNKLGGVKQALVDTSSLPNVGGAGRTALHRLGAAGTNLFASATAEMFAGKWGSQWTIGDVGMGRRESLGSTGQLIRMQIHGMMGSAGLGPMEMASLYGAGSLEELPTSVRNTILAFGTGRSVSEPFTGQTEREAMDWFQNTPLGMTTVGQSVSRAISWAQKIADQGGPKTDYEATRYESVVRNLQSGRYDRPYEAFQSVRAAGAIGGNQQAIYNKDLDELGRGPGRTQWRDALDFNMALGIAVNRGTGASMDALRATPLGDPEVRGNYPTWRPASARAATLASAPGWGAVGIDDEQSAADAGIVTPAQKAANANVRAQVEAREQQQIANRLATFGGQAMTRVWQGRSSSSTRGSSGFWFESEALATAWSSGGSVYSTEVPTSEMESARARAARVHQLMGSRLLGDKPLPGEVYLPRRQYPGERWDPNSKGGDRVIGDELEMEGLRGAGQRPPREAYSGNANQQFGGIPWGKLAPGLGNLARAFSGDMDSDENFESFMQVANEGRMPLTNEQLRELRAMSQQSTRRPSAGLGRALSAAMNKAMSIGSGAEAGIHLQALQQAVSARGSAGMGSLGMQPGIIDSILSQGFVGLGQKNLDLLQAGMTAGQAGSIDTTMSTLQSLRETGGIGTLTQKKQLMKTIEAMGNLPMGEDEQSQIARNTRLQLQGVLSGAQWRDAVPKGFGGPLMGDDPMTHLAKNAGAAAKELETLVPLLKEQGETLTAQRNVRRAERELKIHRGPRGRQQWSEDWAISPEMDPAYAEEDEALQAEVAQARGEAQALGLARQAGKASFGQRLRADIKGIGRRFTGERTFMGGFELMYMARMASLTTTPFMEAGQEVEAADLQSRVGLAAASGGSVGEASPYQQLAATRSAIRQQQGIAFNQAWLPTMQAAAGIGGIAGPALSIGAPAFGAAMLASYLGGPALGMAVGGAVAGVGAVSYGASQGTDAGQWQMAGEAQTAFRHGSWMDQQWLNARSAMGEMGWALQGNLFESRDTYRQQLHAREATIAGIRRAGYSTEAVMGAPEGARGVAMQQQGQEYAAQYANFGLGAEQWQSYVAKVRPAVGGAFTENLVTAMGAQQLMGIDSAQIAGAVYQAGTGRTFIPGEGSLSPIMAGLRTPGDVQRALSAQEFGGQLNQILPMAGLDRIDIGTTNRLGVAGGGMFGWEANPQLLGRSDTQRQSVLELARRSASMVQAGQMSGAQMSQLLGGADLTRASELQLQRMTAGLGTSQALYGRYGGAISAGVQAMIGDYNVTSAEAATLTAAMQGSPTAAARIMQTGGMSSGEATFMTDYQRPEGGMLGGSIFQNQGSFAGSARTAQQWGQSFGLTGSRLQAWTSGIQTEFGTIAGAAGVRFQAQRDSLAASWASLGVQAAGVELRHRFTTGEGMPGGRGFWQIEDDMTSLGRERTQWGWQMAERGAAMQQRQFQEGWGAQVAQFQTQRQWQQQDFGTQAQRMAQARAWRREDWGVQDDVRALQWGWNQEDMAENIRYSSGRARRVAVRERERATTMHNVEDEGIDRERTRAKAQEKMEDEDFKKQQERAKVLAKYREDDFERQMKFFKESQALQTEDRKKQQEFTKEQWKLEDEQRKLQRAFFLEQEKLQRAAIGAQAAQLKAQGELQKLEENLYAKDQTQRDLWIMAADGMISRAREIMRILGMVRGWEHGKQIGGAATAGEPIMMGERGPEMFIPYTAGTVIPSQNLIGMPTGGATTTTGGVNFGATSSTQAALVLRAITELVRELGKVNPDSAKAVKNTLAVLAVQ